MIDKNLFISGVTNKFPEEILEGRLTAEGNVISCLLKDLLLIDDVKLSSSSFLSKDGRFIFGLCSDIRKKHFNSIDEVTVLSNSKEAVIERLNEIGGWETLQNMTDIVKLNNFDTYLDILYRENLLCNMHKDGFNLMKEIDINGKKVKPLTLFRKMTSSQVIDFYDSRLSGYDVGQNSNVIEEEYIDFDDEWLNSLEEGEDLGTPYDICGFDVNGEQINGFRFLSNQTLGLHHGCLMDISGFSSVGKSTIICTIIMAMIYRGEKCIVISNEESIKKYKIKLMMWLLSRRNRYFKLSKSKLASGQLNDEDRRQINIAREYWKEEIKGKLKFVAVDTTDISLVKKKIRDAHLREGISLFVYDTFKLNDSSFSGERTDLSIVKDSRELQSLAMKYDMIGICTSQIAERFKGTLTLNASHLSGAKALKEILQQLFMLRTLFPEEMDKKSKYYCNPFRLTYCNGKWIEEEYELDQSSVYIVLTVEKNRDGIDTPSNGISYLLKFDGAYSTFREVAQCRCKHGMIV